MFSKSKNSIYLIDEGEGSEIECAEKPKNFFNGLSEIMKLNESMVNLNKNQAESFCNELFVKFGLRKNFTEVLTFF